MKRIFLFILSYLSLVSSQSYCAECLEDKEKYWCGRSDDIGSCESSCPFEANTICPEDEIPVGLLDMGDGSTVMCDCNISSALKILNNRSGYDSFIFNSNEVPQFSVVLRATLTINGYFCNPIDENDIQFTITTTLNSNSFSKINYHPIECESNGQSIKEINIDIKDPNNFFSTDLFKYHGDRNSVTISIDHTNVKFGMKSVKLRLVVGLAIPSLDLPKAMSVPNDFTNVEVTIPGNNFYLNRFDYKCVLKEGTYSYPPIPAIKVTDDSVNCSFGREILDTKYKHISISVQPTIFNFLNYDYSSVWIYVRPKIDEINPSTWSPEGDQMIYIHGSGFWNDSSPHEMIVYINMNQMKLQIKAKYISENVISFKSPSGHGGPYPIWVSGEEDEQYFNDGEIIFGYSNSLLDLIRTFFKDHPWMYLVIGLAIPLLILIIVLTVWLCYRRKLLERDKKKINELTSGSDKSILITFPEIKLKERVGEGTFAVVHRGYWRKSEVAVKCFKGNHITDINEASIMIKLRHPNVVTFMGLSYHKGSLWIITEYLANGSLCDRLRDASLVIEEAHVKKMALDICTGMTYLHGFNLIHRDLKSSNLLLDRDWNIKVCDFGLSKEISDLELDKTMTAVGTPSWSAPEILRNQKYSNKADVYSFGIILWEMFERKPPFESTPSYQIIIMVATEGARPKISSIIPADFKNIITKSWEDDPNKRPSFSTLVETIREIETEEPTSTKPWYNTICDSGSELKLF